MIKCTCYGAFTPNTPVCLGPPRFAPRLEGDSDAFLDALAARRDRDIARAATGIGPHLDDVVLAERRELRSFGSQGEQRSAVLALLLAEATLLERSWGEQPILLLDDVLSELDAVRRARLIDAVRAHGQSIVTATEAAHLPGAPDRVIEVADGALAE